VPIESLAALSPKS